MPLITKSDFIRAMDMIVEAPEAVNVVYLYKSEMEKHGETFRSAGYSVILIEMIPCPTSEKPQSE
jgi:hypothetical protein